MASDVNVDWYRLIGEWRSLPHGQKSSWLDQLERRFQISKDQFYRQKRQLVGKSKEAPKPQTDAYKRKRKIVELVLEMKERGKQRSDSPREMPTEVCLKRLEARGIIAPDEISPAHVNTIARDEYMYREQTPRHRWECEYALQEIQTDGSTSKYYRPWKTLPDGDVLLKASGRPLRYKGREDGHPKVIPWQFQDKYSRLRIVRAIPGKAESVMIALATAGFWMRREEDEHLMRHIPWQFARDNASLFRTDEWKNFLRGLELDPDDPEDQRKSKPYEKTGIGSVENRWQTIWNKELVWSEDYPQIKLSEYNQLLHWAMIEEQSEEHPYFSGAKGELYQKSLLRQEPRPKMLAADVFDIACRRFDRTVTNKLTVPIEGTEYRVPQYWESIPLMGRQVAVWRNYRGELVGSLKDVYTASNFTLEPYEHRLKGDFSGSHSRTYQQRLKDAIAEGDSMYDAVMSGKTVIWQDGDYVDSDTGEVLTPARPAALMPTQYVAGDSPFSDRSPDPAGPEEFDSAYEAKAWIGKQLSPYGITYSDVAGYLNEQIELRGLGKEWIAQVVEELTEDFEQQQAKTG